MKMRHQLDGGSPPHAARTLPYPYPWPQYLWPASTLAGFVLTNLSRPQRVQLLAVILPWPALPSPVHS